MVQVIPGAEPWSCTGGDVGVLLVHGLTGNPVSLRPLAEDLAQAGYAVELPRLPGHGTRWQDLATTRWRDWVREAAAALERLRTHTRAQVAMGLSMGAAIALHLAQTGRNLSGIVAVNPSVACASVRERLAPAASLIVRSRPGIGNDIAKPGGDEKPYARIPTKAAASFIKAREQVREDLGAVTTPLLVLTSRNDHTVPPFNSRIVLDGVSSTDKRHVWLERSFHVATLDHDACLVAAETIAFVRRVTAGDP